MKLLFDQNISFRIVNKIQSIFIGSNHVKALGLEDSSDIGIWNYAKANGFAVITFDADFADIANIKGCPPKIIWLRTGNTSTNKIIEIIEKYQNIIIEFNDNIEYQAVACLEIE